jgi:class 3 adenylate cyclase/tetratricopeptide (TPR) repeat protein
MQCSQCQTQNRDGRRFCSQCGAALERPCTACGFQNRAGEAFCGGCGVALGATKSRVGAGSGAAAPSASGIEPGERRQLTVMFCDLADSTALSNRLDPEELSDVLRSYQQCCTDVIGRFGGLVAKYMGDGILIYFGYPQAHEDDVERAVLAALAVTTEVPRLRPHADLMLRVRIGIATGLVVVGELIGQGASQEQSVVGQTPNLAARLQAVAEPDTVVISAGTHVLIGGLFECSDLGLLSLKGFDEPVRAWRVQRESRAVSRFEALRATTTPLVGRDEEVELLLRRWEKTKTGEGSVVLVSGEAGIGKSRLAKTLLHRLIGEPHTHLRYSCSPHYQDSALWPSIAQLEHAAGFRRDDTAEQKLTKIEAVLALSTTNLAAAVPIAANMLSVATGDRYPALELTPQKHKEKALRTILEQIEGLAARRPVVILYEDIHWSDPMTRELLDMLVDRAAALRALLIFTFRPEFLPPWIDRPQVTLLSLNRLAPRHRAEMIRNVARGKTLPEEIASQITDRTDGVPLFIEEFTKSVVESGLLEEAGDRYSVTGPVPPMAIPTSLQASLLARLDRLSSTREVVQIAAALGRNFSHELIGAVAAMPQQALDHALDQLVQAELIHRRGTPPDAEYSFKHALVRDAAYSILLRGPRQQLHRRIVAKVEEHFPELAVSQPALLARHCTEAGLAEKAVAYWLEAGRQARSRSAMMEAEAHLQKGLEVLAALPDTMWRREQELNFQMTLITALRFTKGYSAGDVGETLTRARALAEQLDRPEHLVRLSIAQWEFHFNRSEHRLALPLAEQLTTIGEARSDGGLQLLGRRMSGHTRLHRGEFVAAHALLETCHGLRDQTSPRGGAGSPTSRYDVMLAALAAALANLGYLDQARLRLNEALSEARRVGQAQSLAEVLVYAAWMDSVISSPGLSMHAEKLMTISTEHGFPYYLGWGKTVRGWSLSARGQPREGLAFLTDGLLIVRATGGSLNTALALMWLAETYAFLGQHVEGLSCLAEAARLIDATDERSGEAAFYRVRGQLHSAAGDPEAAERDYHRAIAVATSQSARLLELQASISLARLWRDQDKRVAAHGLLERIYGWFSEGFDAPDLAAAKALLGELATPS